MSQLYQREMQLLYRLSELGEVPTFEPGERVARGFADLGYEEFLVLPGERLVSLVNGKGAALQEEHRKFFFRLFSVDELILRLGRRGRKIVSIEYKDQREFLVSTSVWVQPGVADSVSEGRGALFVGESLLEALLVEACNTIESEQK